MKVCVTRSQRRGYSETFIQNQIVGLTKLTSVVSLHSGRLPERSEDGKLLNPFLYWLINQIIKGLTGRRNNFFSHYGLRRFLKENEVDVLLANYGLSASHLMPVCEELNIPEVVIFHGYDATLLKIVNQYRSRYKKLFESAAAIVAVSNDMKQKLIDLGAKPDKINVIPCGISLEKFRPSEEKSESPLFIAVGRFAHKKAPLQTIRAFKKVLDEIPSAKLVMIGGKSGLYDECVKLVSQLQIHDAVIFTGILNPDDVASYMQRAHVFVQHSITAMSGDMEGTPNSILEAGATGLPVVSTFHGGIKDAVVHGKTGFLVEENDIEEMAEYMVRLIRDTELAKSMGVEARKHIESNYNVNDQIFKLYSVLLSARKN